MTLWALLQILTLRVPNLSLIRQLIDVFCHILTEYIPAYRFLTNSCQLLANI